MSMWKKNNDKTIYRTGEYKQFIFLRILSIGFIFLLIGGLIFGIFFIQHNIFQTIDRAEEIIVLKNNLVNEVIDFNKYDNVKNNWDLKTMDTTSIFEQNPFANTTSTEIIL